MLQITGIHNFVTAEKIFTMLNGNPCNIPFECPGLTWTDQGITHISESQTDYVPPPPSLQADFEDATYRDLPTGMTVEYGSYRVRVDNILFGSFDTFDEAK